MRFYHSWSTFKAEYFSFGHKLQLIRTRMYVGLNPLEFALVLDLSLNLHVDYICARANARLHYLKRLKRAGLPTDRLAIRHQTSS